VLPISLFGTEAQKAKYLPRLLSAEIVGAYALSEAGSGSDALAAKTRATKLPDGSWSLVGREDVDLERRLRRPLHRLRQGGRRAVHRLPRRARVRRPQSGKEEHKMGLHGSSTTTILLQDVRVPADNVLGEIGRGHKVALNTLNYGRFSLGAMCAGGSRGAIGDAAKYAAGRKQFGQPIAAFGAIKHKLGEMVARTYAAESLAYRTAGLIDAASRSRIRAAPRRPARSRSSRSRRRSAR
jgi:alkylation response protein AidB-like acyl-CoA dehydrogenase